MRDSEGHRILIAPSLLSVDFGDLREEIRRAEEGGADLFHVDVMDGHFVPNITLGPFIVEAIRGATEAPLDVHLMIDEPARYARDFADAGAAIITYHVECREGGPETAERIRETGARPGVTLSPFTMLGAIEEHLRLVDLVLVMSVVPGSPGQGFMPEVLSKVRELREDRGFTGDVEMDGGIDPETIGSCAAAGANVFVAGSAVFGHEDPGARVKLLRELAAAAVDGVPDAREEGE